MSETQKKADVVIPVYKPDADFEKVLHCLLNQTIKPGKIVLMVTECEGFTCPDYTTLGPIETHSLTEKEFDHGGTRNLGLQKTDSDYVVFLTQDAVPKDERFLENLLSGFSRTERVAACYARQLPKENCRFIEAEIRAFNYPAEPKIQGKEDIPRLGIKTFFLSDVASVYDRKIFENLGGFDTHMIFNEDMLFAAKAVEKDYRVVYEASAEVFHSHNYTLKQQFKRNFDLGVSQADHPEVFEAVSSEKEGGSMVKRIVKTLFKSGKWYLLPYFVCQCGAKFLGYRAGKRYRKLSRKTILKFTMNKNYWEA